MRAVRARAEVAASRAGAGRSGSGWCPCAAVRARRRSLSDRLEPGDAAGLSGCPDSLRECVRSGGGLRWRHRGQVQSGKGPGCRKHSRIGPSLHVLDPGTAAEGGFGRLHEPAEAAGSESDWTAQHAQARIRQRRGRWRAPRGGRAGAGAVMSPGDHVFRALPLFQWPAGHLGVRAWNAAKDLYADRA